MVYAYDNIDDPFALIEKGNKLRSLCRNNQYGSKWNASYCYFRASTILKKKSSMKDSSSSTTATSMTSKEHKERLALSKLYQDQSYLYFQKAQTTFMDALQMQSRHQQKQQENDEEDTDTEEGDCQTDTQIKLTSSQKIYLFKNLFNIENDTTNYKNVNTNTNSVDSDKGKNHQSTTATSNLAPAPSSSTSVTKDEDLDSFAQSIPSASLLPSLPAPKTLSLEERLANLSSSSSKNKSKISISKNKDSESEQQKRLTDIQQKLQSIGYMGHVSVDNPRRYNNIMMDTFHDNMTDEDQVNEILNMATDECRLEEEQYEKNLQSSDDIEEDKEQSDCFEIDDMFSTKSDDSNYSIKEEVEEGDFQTDKQQQKHACDSETMQLVTETTYHELKQYLANVQDLIREVLGYLLELEKRDDKKKSTCEDEEITSTEEEGKKSVDSNDQEEETTSTPKKYGDVIENDVNNENNSSSSSANSIIAGEKNLKQAQNIIRDKIIPAWNILSSFLRSV